MKYILLSIVAIILIVVLVKYKSQKAREEYSKGKVKETYELLYKQCQTQIDLYKKQEQERDSLDYILSMAIAKLGSAGEIKMLRHEENMRARKTEEKERDEKLQAQMEGLDKKIKEQQE